MQTRKANNRKQNQTKHAKTPVILHTDNSAVKMLSNKLGAGRLRHIKGRLLWLQAKVLSGDLCIRQVKSHFSLVLFGFGFVVVLCALFVCLLFVCLCFYFDGTAHWTVYWSITSAFEAIDV